MGGYFDVFFFLVGLLAFDFAVKGFGVLLDDGFDDLVAVGDVELVVGAGEAVAVLA